MDRIPLYARGGAVIPMWPEAPPSTDGYHPTVIELHVFVPGEDGTWTSELQEDDGLTTTGGFLRTTFTLTRSADEVDAARGRRSATATRSTRASASR